MEQSIPEKAFTEFTDEELSEHEIHSVFFKFEGNTVGPVWILFEETFENMLDQEVNVKRPYTNNEEGYPDWYELDEARKIADDLGVPLEQF